MSTPQQEIAARIQDWQRGRPRGPYTLELYPTLRCNLDCAFCDTTYRKKRAADELSAERYLRLVDEAAAMEVERVYILGGGEPMVARRITPAVMSRLKEHGMYGILGTNGTLFTADLLRRIVDMCWDEIHFSLDGATAAVNDLLRGQDGVFRRVTEVIRRLRGFKRDAGSGYPRILLHTVVTRHNYRQLEDIVRLAHELGCFRVNFDALVPYRPEQVALAMRARERAEMPALAERALRRAEEYGIESSLEQFLNPRTLERGSMRFAPADGSGVFSAPCLNPWHHVVVHHNGFVSPCCVIPSEPSADSVRERGLEEVWFHGEYFNRLRGDFIDGRMTRHCSNCSMSIISQNDCIREYFDV